MTDEIDQSEDTGAEYETTADEFRALMAECEESNAKLLQFANRVQQRAPDAAEAVRQVTGELVPLMQNIVMAAGAAFEAIEEEVDEGASGGEGIGMEDAVNFYRTLTANNKMVEEVLAAVSTDEQRTALVALKLMNDEMLERVVELSGEDEGDIRVAAERPVAQSEGAPGESGMN